MKNIVKYGISVGQIWSPADGSGHQIEVLALLPNDDVLVKFLPSGETFEVDAWKMACVRYYRPMPRCHECGQWLPVPTAS